MRVLAMRCALGVQSGSTAARYRFGVRAIGWSRDSLAAGYFSALAMRVKK